MASRVKLIRPMIGRSPSEVRASKDITVTFPSRPVQNEKREWVWPAGTVIEHWQAFRLVQQGVAITDNEEAVELSARSEQQLTDAQAAYEKVSRGIHPDDYERYDRGEIEGYNPDGSYIPGPNWVEEEDEILSDDFYEDEDDDE